jgi:DNA-binding Lrp family transcriptional regulator
MNEQALLLELTKSELAVYEYLKKRVEKTGQNEIKESNRDIGKQIDLSEATVHRALKKLKKLGVIGVIPTEGRAQSNTIVFHGIPDETEEVDDIFSMVSKLNSSMNRFQHILASKNNEILRLQSELDEAYARIQELQDLLEKSHRVIQGFQELLLLTNEGVGEMEVEDMEVKPDGRHIVVLRPKAT